MKLTRTLFAFALSILSIGYLLPTGIAIGRSRTNTGSITVVNVFLGWTLIGWVVALAWSIAKDEKEVIESEVPSKRESVKKDVNRNLWIVVGLVMLFGIVIVNSYTDEQSSSAINNVVTEEPEETMKEKMDRWDRGEFTAEEIAEIREEEEREGAALKEMRY